MIPKSFPKKKTACTRKNIEYWILHESKWHEWIKIRNLCYFLWWHQLAPSFVFWLLYSKRTIQFSSIFHHKVFHLNRIFECARIKRNSVNVIIIRKIYFVLTRYPPKCRTWQVNVASLPTATEIFTIGSANSGWNVRTSGKIEQTVSIEWTG